MYKISKIYLQKRLQVCNYFIQIHQLSLKNKGKSNIMKDLVKFDYCRKMSYNNSVVS